MGFGFLIVGSQRCWSHCDWHYKGGAQQSRIQETGHSLSPGGQQSNRCAKPPATAVVNATI
jgi:hypothetical protein